MRRLEVDLEEVALIMEDQDRLNDYFLDLSTGDLIVIPSELQYTDSFNADRVEGFPAWERDLLSLVEEIEGGSERYEPVPRIPSYEIYDLMVEFAESVSDPHLSALLSVALDGRGAFGRFKRVLEDYPRELERWFDIKEAALRERVCEWLNGLGIEPVER